MIIRKKSINHKVHKVGTKNTKLDSSDAIRLLCRNGKKNLVFMSGSL
jgi:hypothetical protein